MEGINEIQEVAAPFLAARSARKQRERLEVAGLSLRHIKLLFYRWLLRALCGWVDSLLYRDAGERGIRSFLAFGNLPLAVVFVLLSILLGSPGTVFYLVVTWAFAFYLADRLAARNRRQHEREEGYLYSYFIGWPRWLNPRREASRWHQGAILAAVGVIVFVWDHSGGILLTATGAGECALQRIHRLIRREEVMDELDAEWQDARRDEARQEITGPSEEKELTDEDYMRVYSA